MAKNIDEIYKTYVPDVKRYLLSLTKNHHLTEDLLQETFLRAYLNIEKCPLSGVKPWLFKISYHLYLDYIKKHKPIVMEDVFFRLLEANELIEEIMVKKEQIQDLNSAINSLSERQQQGISLVYYGGLTYEEAAGVMNISVSLLKVTIFRSKKIIKELLEEVNKDE